MRTVTGVRCKTGEGSYFVRAAEAGEKVARPYRLQILVANAVWEISRLHSIS